MNKKIDKMVTEHFQFAEVIVYSHAEKRQNPRRIEGPYLLDIGKIPDVLVELNRPLRVELEGMRKRVLVSEEQNDENR